MDFSDGKIKEDWLFGNDVLQRIITQSSSSFVIPFAAAEPPSLASVSVNSDPVVSFSLLTGNFI